MRSRIHAKLLLYLVQNRKIEDNAISTDPHAAAMEAARQAMMRRKLVGGTAIGTKPPEQVQFIVEHMQDL